MLENKKIAYYRRCQGDTRYKRGRCHRWHCLVCGSEHINLSPRVEVDCNLPPRFLLDKHPNGELGLYAGMPVATNVQGEEKVVHYLKGVFSSDAKLKEIEKSAWAVYMALKKKDSCV